VVGFAFLACGSAQGGTQSLGKAGGYKYVVAKQAHVQGSDGPQVSCGTSREPSGGGGAISGKPKGGRLVSSFPDGAAHVWQTIGAVQGPGTRTVRSYTVCTKADVTYSEHTVAVPPGNNVGSGGDPACAAGRLATGGGAMAAGEAALLATEPVRVPPSTGDFLFWQTTVENRSAATIDSTFHTACLPGPFAYRVTDGPAKPGQATKIMSRCHKHEHVVGGGVAGQFTAGFKLGYIHDSRPWDSGDPGHVPDDGWLGGVQNLSDDQRFAGVWAVCDKG
jgi:hypothetical protein